MVVLKKEKPILILFRSAFYKEIEEIPKKIKNKMNKNGGCGTVFENGLYFWSNTSGVTAGKMFKKERDGLVLEPINHSELLKINKYQDLDYIESIIGQNTFNIHYDVNSYYDCMTIRGCYNIPESDFIVKPDKIFLYSSILIISQNLFSYLFLFSNSTIKFILIEYWCLPLNKFSYLAYSVSSVHTKSLSGIL